MDPLQKIEDEIRQRNPGWWARVVEIIPELSELDRTPQRPDYHAEGDVGVHTRMALDACRKDCDPDVLWAALLHDIGKPAVTRKVDGKITAPGHHKAGAEAAEKILKRLCMPADRLERIIWVIQNHIFHIFWNLAAPEEASKRHKRFVADPRFPLLLELLRVDTIASWGKKGATDPYLLYKRLWEIVRDGNQLAVADHGDS